MGRGILFSLIGSVLAVFEISLCFDNAIVNANKLKDMTSEWQQRFLTWGILIAVFGMRIVCPLAVVVIAARIGPWGAIVLAAAQPDEYARIMNDAHISISAFGGTFLMMVALSYFFFRRGQGDRSGACDRASATVLGNDPGTGNRAGPRPRAAVHGEPTTRRGSGISLCLGLRPAGVLTCGTLGSNTRQRRRGAKSHGAGGLGAFLYLEVLDASFSFDGVIGAFALTQNLFLIAIGLGIGAFYVRSMTIMLVQKETLAEFRYLEHGAFYSILSLSFIMFANSIWHVPEVITGLLGAGLIGLALWSSLRHNILALKT